MASSVLLPCAAHAECAYHKSGPKPSAPHRTVNTAITDKYPNFNNSRALKSDQNDQGPKVAPIQALPTELLLCIIEPLTVCEQAFLALSCKAFYSILGPSLWPKISKAKGATWRQHDEFLDSLEPYLKDDYWRCPDCIQFHPRRGKTTEHDAPNHPFQHSTEQRLSLKSLFLKKKKQPKSTLRLGLIGQPIYSLPFTLVTSILSRHHAQSPTGTCLNALKCQGGEAISLNSPIEDFPCTFNIFSTFTSKVVLDRLLLRAKYSVRLVFPKDPLMTAQPTVNRAYIMILERLFGALPFYICAHTALWETPVSNLVSAVKVDKRCSYCPTQYTARLTHPGPCMDRGGEPLFQYTVYHNFGQVGSENEVQWGYLVQPRRRKKRDMREYPWDKEDIEQAFERIMCSTVEEFRRQLDRSDGRGSWYDPTLMKRGYKTLPESVAVGIGGITR